MARNFQGVLFDAVEVAIVDRAPVVRCTYAEAMADARAMVDAVNEQAEAFDDQFDNSTVGRVDESYCFVLVDGQIAYSEMEVA